MGKQGGNVRIMIISLLENFTSGLSGVQLLWAILTLIASMSVIVVLGIVKVRIIYADTTAFRTEALALRKKTSHEVKKENPKAKLGEEGRKKIRDELLAMEKKIRHDTFVHVLEWTCVTFISVAVMIAAVVVLKVI